MNLPKFLAKWRQHLSQSLYNEFVEDLRCLLIWRLLEFRKDQKTGKFTDKTGDGYLGKCKATLK